MYRNTYLQLYKQSLQPQETVASLLRHFHNLYSALGFVLQDLQYTIAKQSFDPPPLKPPPAYLQHSPNHSLPSQRAQPPISVKVQDNLRLAQPYDFAPKLNQFKKQEPRLEARHSQTSENSSNNSSFNFKKVDKSLSRPSNQLEIEKVRNEISFKASDSFDALFDPKKNEQHYQQKIIQNVQKNKPQKMQVIRQVPNQQEQSQMGSYEDLMDRIFRDSQSRRSR